MTMLRPRAGHLILSLSLSLACGCGSASGPEPGPSPASSPPETKPLLEPAPESDPVERLDAHVHLVNDAADELLATLDRHAIAAAVVLASPHLDPSVPPPPGIDEFAGWRGANDRLLDQTKAHRDRLIPFITVEPAEVRVAELEAWQAAGACGVKIYSGHQNFHRRALDDPEHDATFAALERLGMPVLLHVNTVRFEAELDGLIQAHPGLALVCAHLCGSRTDLDRLERIMRAHPNLLVDTSHGPGQPGVEGFTNLEREGERLRELIAAAPERFVFGSDLVTSPTVDDPSATRLDWDRQIAANLGLIEAERFEFFRETAPGATAMGSYAGLALRGPPRAAVLAGNARRWLGPCAP